MRWTPLIGLLALACGEDLQDAPVISSGVLAVTLEGPDREEAYIVIGKTRGNFDTVNVIRSGEVLLFDREGPSTVLLVVMRDGGTRCESVDGFDSVPPGTPVRFSVDSQMRDTNRVMVETPVRVALPQDLPEGTASLYVGGCGGGESIPLSQRHYELNRCSVVGRTSDFVAVARDASGRMTGATRVRDPVDLSNVVLGDYIYNRREHEINLVNLPDGTTGGTIKIVVRNARRDYKEVMEFDFVPRVGTSEHTSIVDFPIWNLQPTISTELNVGNGKVSLGNLFVESLNDLSEHIDAGGNAPVVTRVRVTPGNTPENPGNQPTVSWDVDGTDPDGVVISANGDGFEWNVTSRRRGMSRYEVPRLPARLSACSLELSPGSSVGVYAYEGQAEQPYEQQVGTPNLSRFRRVSRNETVFK
ncbi:MAG: hypothetical protein AAF449_20355 [Myxococcota bacterium]